MAKKILREIVQLVVKAADLARSIGINNLLQPGLVKEMIIAETLGHELIHSKRDADAHAPGNTDEKYEYLSCKEGGSGQLDRMFKGPSEKRSESLFRITRNKKIYLAIFYTNNQTKVKTIYELEPKIVLRATELKLNRSSNQISRDWFYRKLG